MLGAFFQLAISNKRVVSDRYSVVNGNVYEGIVYVKRMWTHCE